MTTESGIYQLTIGPRTRYYGQAQDLRAREYNHFHFLRKGTHHNRHLQASFNKHGEDALAFKTLLVCEIDELNRYEQQLLDVHHGTPGCANVAKCAEAPGRGLKRSEETLEKLRRIQKAYWACPKRREEAREAGRRAAPRPGKPVLVTWASGKTEKFHSVRAVARKLGYKNSGPVTNWLSGLKPIPKKHGITSVTRL